mmetsp:Transcript_24018/g.38441  ORF Transcript_24018/g.38441 Transcript_24018/m.38441 type:complete len:151 (-) Transcript_24018:507-959(-)
MLEVLTIDISVTHCFNCQTMGGIKAVVGPSIWPRPASSCGQLLRFFAVVLGQHFLDLPNGKSWIQSLRTSLCAVHDGMTSIYREFVLHLEQSFTCEIVARVHHPSVRLHEDRWAEVFVRVPPVTGTGSTAACTQDALIQSIQFGSIPHGL